VPRDSRFSLLSSGGGAHLLELGDIDLAEHGPEEADHLTGNGGDGDLGGLFDGEAVKEGVETVLALPGVADDPWVLTVLAPSEGGADGGAFSVLPGGLDKGVAYAAVTGLGDGAEALSGPGGVLAGHEADVGHELTGAGEAAQVAELGGDDHGGLSLEAAETAEAFDHGFVAGGEGEGLDAAVELVPTLELVLEEGEVLGEHHVIFIGKGARSEDLADPVEVTDGPVVGLAEDESPPAHEFEDIMAALDDLALEGLAASNQVPDSFVLLGGDVDQDEAVVTEVTADLDGIAAVGLAALPGTARDERGSGEVALDAPRGEGALEDVAGAGGFVAGADGALSLEALEIAADLSEVVGQAVHMQGLGITIPEHSDGDGILVDVESDPEVDGKGHGAGLLRFAA
jgi:hypothetical protein